MVLDAVAVSLDVAVDDGDPVGLGDPDCDRLTDDVPLALGVREKLGVAPLLGDAVELGLCDADVVCEAVSVTLPLCV